jgi:hypothetical protein
MENLALEARCKFAMFNVLMDIDPPLAELSFLKAIDLARRYGARGAEKSAFLMGEIDLEAAFDAGLAIYTERHADKTNDEWISVFEKLAGEAGRSCAQSHDLYQQRFSEEVNRAIQYQTDERQAELMDLAKHWDYATGDELMASSRWNDEHGYCSHGIELGCCPAGCE